MQKSKIKNVLKGYAIYLVLIVLVIIFSCVRPVFFTFDNIITILRQVSMIGIAGVGMMFVLITGGIDLSIGSIVSLTCSLEAILMVNYGMNPWVAVILVTLLMTFVGFLQGVMIAKFHIPPFITTLAFMNILSGIALLITGGLPILNLPQSFLPLGKGYVGPIPIPVIIMVVMFVIGWLILNKIYFGRYIYAIGGSEEASLLCGINVARTKIIVYMLSALFTAIAGAIMLARLSSGLPTCGTGFEFNVVIAVILGGVSVSGGEGKISGMIAGVLIIGVLDNGMIIMNINSYIQSIIMGVICLIAVGFDCAQKMRRSSK